VISAITWRTRAAMSGAVGVVMVVGAWWQNRLWFRCAAGTASGVPPERLQVRRRDGKRLLAGRFRSALIAAATR
jgi:hypothetical protein